MSSRDGIPLAPCSSHGTIRRLTCVAMAQGHEDIEGNIRVDKLSKYAAQEREVPFLDIPSNRYLIPNHLLPNLAPWIRKFKTTKVRGICHEKQREISARTKGVLRRVRLGRIFMSRSQDVELVELQIQKAGSLQIVPVREPPKVRQQRALSAANSPIKAVASSEDAGLIDSKRKPPSKKQKLIQPPQPRDERQLTQLNTATVTQNADTNFAGPFDVTLGRSEMDEIIAMVKTGLEHFHDFFRNQTKV